MGSKADLRTSNLGDYLPLCCSISVEPAGVLGCGTWVDFTFLQWEELEWVNQQIAIVYLLCVLLGYDLWRILKK